MLKRVIGSILSGGRSTIAEGKTNAINNNETRKYAWIWTRENCVFGKMICSGSQSSDPGGKTRPEEEMRVEKGELNHGCHCELIGLKLSSVE